MCWRIIKEGGRINEVEIIDFKGVLLIIARVLSLPALTGKSKRLSNAEMIHIEKRQGISNRRPYLERVGRDFPDKAGRLRMLIMVVNQRLG